MHDDDLQRRANGLEWLLFDVDGVLTDGVVYYTAKGESLKPFHVRDGLAFRIAQGVGLKLGLLTGRRSKPLARRAKELDFDSVVMGSKDKNSDFDRFLRKARTVPGKVAYIGDDLPDLPVLGRSALAFAPADAAPEVRAMVHTVLTTPGGRGAAREMIELLLEARGEWRQAVARYSLEA